MRTGKRGSPAPARVSMPGCSAAGFGVPVRVSVVTDGPTLGRRSPATPILEAPTWRFSLPVTGRSGQTGCGHHSTPDPRAGRLECLPRADVGVTGSTSPARVADADPRHEK